MTQLHVINKHQISLLCECGHNRAFSIKNSYTLYAPTQRSNKSLIRRDSQGVNATLTKGFGFTGSVRKDKKLDNKQAPL